MVTSLQEEVTCFERIGTGTYNSMAPHPDGSARVFLSTQEGKILLASVPARGRSGGTLQINDDSLLFLDLTDRVLGLVGIAFHPEFTTNGRFFVSYTCTAIAASRRPATSVIAPLLLEIALCRRSISSSSPSSLRIEAAMTTIPR